jgi:hypothetical protein
MTTDTEKALTRLKKTWTGTLRVFGFLWLLGSIIVALVMFASDDGTGVRMLTGIAVLAQGVLGYAVCDMLSAIALGVRISLDRLAALERLAAMARLDT